MSRYYVGWALWLLAGAGYEVWAVWGRKAPGDTFSEFTARLFHSGSTAGFAALTALLTFLLLWYPIHTRRFDKRAKLVVVDPEPDAFDMPTSFHEQPTTKAPRSVPPEDQERAAGPYGL